MLTIGLGIHQTAKAATVTASLRDAFGDPSSTILQPGDTFDVNVLLDSTVSLTSAQFNTRESSASGYFTLNSVVFDDNLWDVNTVVDPTVQSLDSTNGFTSGDIGTIADNLLSGTGTGQLALVTLNLSIDPAAADGTYTLNLTGLVFGDTNFAEIQSVASGPDYHVVVPEPGALGLLLLGAILLILRCRRIVRRRQWSLVVILAVAFSVALVGNARQARADDDIQVIHMHPGSVTACNAIFEDSGVYGDSYDSVEDWVLTFYPDDPTSAKVRMVFSEFDTDPQFTSMHIYDGNSTAAPEIGHYAGNASPGTVISSATDGSLTVQWFAGSRGFPNYTGWKARVTCVPARSVSFQASGQSMWGPGPGATIPDSQRVEFLTINYNDHRPDRHIVDVLGSQFGADVYAGVTGDVGFLVRFKDIGPGAVGVNYPVEVTLAGPPEDEFRPGDWVTIDSRARVKQEESPAISAAAPDLGVDLDARASLTANVTGEACAFSCESFNLFPSINLGGVGTIVGLEPGGNDVRIVTQNISGISTPFDIPPPIVGLTGIGGTLDRPNISLPAGPASTSVANKSLVASSTNQFMTLSMDIDTWILRALGAPPAVRLEIPEVPIFNVAGLWTVYGRYRIMDLKVDTDFHEDYTYSFTPTIHVALDFPQPVQYRARRGATILHEGTGTTIAFDAGDSIDFIAPDSVMDVVPTISLVNPQFSTQTSTRFVRSYREKMMELGIRVPSRHVGCFPSVGACPVCTPSFCVDSPEVNLNVGPFIDIDAPFEAFNDPRLFQQSNHTFNLQGLTPPVPSTPFAVDPEFKPVPVIDGPTQPFDEGDTVSFSGARSTDRDGDPLTYHWDFGGPGVGPTADGPDVTFIYGDDGTFVVRLTVDDGHGIPVSTTHTVTVLNVPSQVADPADPILDFNEGDDARIPTIATDPGFLDDQTTTVNFGDGSPEQSYTLRHVFGAIPSVGHNYADNGEYTVNCCVRDDDGEGECKSTIARIHNVAPSVSEQHELVTDVPVGVQQMNTNLRLFTSFNDPGTLDTHTARVEWGDGATDDFPLMEAPFGPPGIGSGADGQGIHEYQHVYAARGTYDVRVCVTDDDGGETCKHVETIDVPQSDVRLSQAVMPDGNTPVAVGDYATYTLTVTNNGPDAAPDVLVKDVLPPGMQLISALRSGNGQLETRLTEDDPSDEDYYGTSVSLDGDTLAVGALRFNSGIGEVHVYRTEGAGWSEEATLTASDASPSAFSAFGTDVDVDGDTVIVGANLYPNETGDNVGAAYVFRRNGTTWSEEAQLLADDGSAGDGFGDKVAIEGDTAIVSAPQNDGGAVYVFERNGSTWTQTNKFTDAPDGEFGSDVAISGDTIAIASRGNPYVVGGRPGRVTILRRDNANWSVETTIDETDVPDLVDPDTFAGALTLNGDSLMVATQSFFANTQPGSVHVFERNGTTWTDQARIVADDGELGDEFGSSLDFDGKTLAVGAPRAGDAGTTYVFRRNGNAWSQDAELSPLSASVGSDVGASVAVGGEAVAFGAPTDSDFDMGGFTIYPGAAYIVSVCPESPVGTINCGMGTIASGETATVQIVARVGCLLASDPFVSTTLTNNASVSAQALDYDQANNATSISSITGPPAQGVCDADYAPPLITPMISGTIGQNGWYTSDVTVTWQVVDNDSPIQTETGCGPTTIDTDTTGITLDCTAASLGGSWSNSVTIRRDTTPPVLTSSIAGTEGADGWYTSNVDVSFACSDATSGNDVCPAVTTLSGEGSMPRVFGTATDRAGNSTTLTVDGIKIDKTPPMLTATRTPANAHGWNNGSVAVSFDCMDNISGIAQCPSETTFDTEGANQSVTGSAIDQAGNEASLVVDNINIDLTPPAIVASAFPPANENGWRNTIVAVAFDCADTLSGMDQCAGATELSTEGTGQSVSGTAVDLAGNTATATIDDINIDWTPPSISASASPAPDANGLNDPGVDVNFVCSDDLSGMADCPANIVLDSVGLNQSADGQAMDMAGNVASAAVDGINIGRPAVTASADHVVNEGETVADTFANVSQFNATTGVATIDWGDSTAPETGNIVQSGTTADVIGGHIYADDGTYDVTVCVVDLLGYQRCASSTVTVGNQVPILQPVSVPSDPVVFGTEARISATYTDLGSADTHTATIDWGDGTDLETVDAVEAPFGPPGDAAGLEGSIFAGHTYAFSGEYIGQLCVQDDEGGVDCQTFTLIVAPVRPITCSIDVGEMICNGSTTTIPLTANVENVGDEPVTFLWEADNPNGVYNSLQDNDFDDPTSRTPTLTTDASTGFNVWCTAIFSDESGLPPVTTQRFITPCVPGSITLWQSVREHGNGVGELAIALDASVTTVSGSTQSPTSEPRLGGIRKVLVTFDEPVEAADGALDAGDVAITDSSSHSYAATAVSLDGGASGTILEILFDAGELPNNEVFTIDLSGAFRKVDSGALVAGDTDCEIAGKIGDSNNDGVTDAADVADVLSQNGIAPVSATNVRRDVNADGRLNLIDVALTRRNVDASPPLVRPGGKSPSKGTDGHLCAPALDLHRQS